MSVVEKLDGVKHKVVVSLSWLAINEATDKKLRKIQKNARISGFRPGKAPLKMVASMYGENAQNEVLNDLAQEGFYSLAKEQNLSVASILEIKPVETQDDPESFKVAFIYEAIPDIKVADLSTLEIEKVSAQVDEKEIDNTINILRQQRTRFNRVERAAQEGDRVIIDFEGKIDGKVFEGGASKNYPFVLGKGQMLPEFETGIVGMKEGESKDVTVHFPEEYHGKEVAGKTAIFTITLHNVAAPELPEVDEAFAKSLGIEDGDVAKMREEVKKNVAREVKRRVDAKNTDAVMQALYQAHPFDLPEAFVNQEAERLADKMKHDFAEQGLDVKKLDLPLDMFIDQAKQRVALGLLLPVIIKENKLEATEEQVKTIIEGFADSYEDPQEVIDWYYAEPSRLSGPTNLADEANVVAFVLSKAKVTEKALSFEEVMGANA